MSTPILAILPLNASKNWSKSCTCPSVNLSVLYLMQSQKWIAFWHFFHFCRKFLTTCMKTCKIILTPTTKEPNICHSLATTSAFNLKLCHISRRFSVFLFWIFFLLFFFFWFLCILGPPYCGIGATIHIGQETWCHPYAGFFLSEDFLSSVSSIVWFVKAIFISPCFFAFQLTWWLLFNKTETLKNSLVNWKAPMPTESLNRNIFFKLASV